MKLMIASDIHGSAWWCEKLMEAYAVERPDRLLLLGDILYHGPRNDLPQDYDPKRTAAMLNTVSDRILGVRGNCDAEIDQVLLEWPMMSDSMLLFLNGKTVFATHGHIFGEDRPPRLHPGDVLLCGHTHLQVCRQEETYTYMNPGSVSLPKGDSTHGYMTWEDGQYLWKAMDGEIVMSYGEGVPSGL